MATTVTFLLVLLFVAASSADIGRNKRLAVCLVTLFCIFGVQKLANASTIDMPRTSYYSKDMKPFYEDFLTMYEKSKNHLNLKEEHLDNPTVKAIARAARDAGVDPNFLATMANIESTMDPKARNKRVKGLMQFTPGTWNTMVKRHAKRYSIKRPDIYNPYHNALMGAELAKDNAAWMNKRINRKLKDHEVYMAHFISPLYALKMLKARSNRLAIDIVPASFLVGNKALFYRKGTAMTVGQFIASMKRKVSDKYFEVTVQPGIMLASITVCDMPAVNGSVKPVSTDNDARCTFNQKGAWWDRHITSVLTA